MKMSALGTVRDKVRYSEDELYALADEELDSEFSERFSPPDSWFVSTKHNTRERKIEMLLEHYEMEENDN